MYKGNMDKAKEGLGSSMGGGDCWGGQQWLGGKWRQLYLKKKLKTKLNKKDIPVSSYVFPVLELAFSSLRSSGLFYWDMVLETKIGRQGVLIATGVIACRFSAD